MTGLQLTTVLVTLIHIYNVLINCNNMCLECIFLILNYTAQSRELYTHEGFCSWSMLQGQLARPVHMRKHLQVCSIYPQILLPNI